MSQTFDANARMTQPSIQRLARETRQKMAAIHAQQPDMDLAALGTLPGMMTDLLLALPYVLNDGNDAGERIIYRGRVIQCATKTIGVLEHLLMTLEPVKTGGAS